MHRYIFLNKFPLFKELFIEISNLTILNMIADAVQKLLQLLMMSGFSCSDTENIVNNVM